MRVWDNRSRHTHEPNYKVDRRREAERQKKSPDPLEGDSGLDGANQRRGVLFFSEEGYSAFATT